jgi:hypothetical protein
MKNTWQLVSPETAKAHPLYGIKGWLLFFAAGNLLGLLAFIGSVRREAFIANMSELEFLAIDHPAITFLKVALALNTVGTAIIYWLLFTKHQRFRAVATWLLLGVFPAIVLLGFLNPFDGLGNMIATTLFPWAISCAVWVTYLQKSERVRVTFEHCLKQDEIQRSQPSAQTSIKQAPQSKVLTSTQNKNTQHLATTQAATPLTHSVTPSSTMVMSNSQEHSDDDLWEQALNEYDSSARKQGLWARLFSESEGNETLVKANYLRIRVDEMQQLIGLEKERIETERKIAIAHEIAISETTLLEQQAYDVLPKGVCPNCKKTLLLLSANKCPKCSALFGPHSAFKISEISKQEQLNVLRLLAQNGNSLTEYEAALIKSEQI